MIFQREIYPELKKHLSARQATILTGMRRTGKTTLIRALLADSPSRNTIYLDLERLDNRALFDEKNYDAIVAAFGNRGLKTDEKMYIAIDEIQHAPEAPSAVKYIYDHYDAKFLITGSSSYYLKNLFSESLSGRKKLFELAPLSFSEFLMFRDEKIGNNVITEKKFNNDEYARLSHYYEEFLMYGGFPEVVLTDDASVKRDLLSDIISSYVNIDVKTLSDIRNIDSFVGFVKMLAARACSKIDISKLSRLTGISRPTVHSYLSFLEKTYVIHRLPVFSKSSDRQIAKAQKLYFSDNGLLNSLAQQSSGVLFENSVFNQLRHYGSLSYFSRKSGVEIDFILDGKTAFEAKETPTSTDYSRLQRRAKSIGLKKFHLVGRHESPEFSEYIWGGSIRPPLPPSTKRNN